MKRVVQRRLLWLIGLHYVYLELLSPSGLTGALADGENSDRSYAQAVVRTLFNR